MIKQVTRYEKAKVHKYLGGLVCVCGKPKLKLKVFCPICWERLHTSSEWSAFGEACQHYAKAFRNLKERAKE